MTISPPCVTVEGTRVPRTLRSATRRALAVVVVLAAAAACSGQAPPSAPPSAPALAAPGPGVDAIVTSPNVALRANVPSGFSPASGIGTDLAFQGRFAFAGNYDGFSVYDVADPSLPRLAAQVLCPGPQGDITVSGSLLFLSTDSSRSDDSCASVPKPPVDPTAWEGIKIFDIANPVAPRYIKSVETKCGSHTHTLVGDREGRSVFLYVSSYGPNPTFADCRPPHDTISIVEVPRAAPQTASVVAEPVLFPDGGNPGTRNPNSEGVEPGIATTDGCHDITVDPAKDLAAGACMGEGVLMDISDRRAPRVITRVRDDTNFAFWHSATFNQDGSKVVFTDELGGGGAPACTPAVGPTRGADGIYDVVGEGDQRRLEFRSFYKIPRMQSPTENCVAHNGSLIPVPGRDLMVQSWYQGGVSVWDFTDSTRPHEVGFFERGPLNQTHLVTGGSWSAYWYDGRIYSSDIVKGLDVLEVTDPALTAGVAPTAGELNAQTQPTSPR